MSFATHKSRELSATWKIFVKKITTGNFNSPDPFPKYVTALKTAVNKQGDLWSLNK